MLVTNFILGYILTWILMTVVVTVLLAISEAVNGFILMRLSKNGSSGEHPVKLIIWEALSPIQLPSCASRPISLIMPVFAIAALFPVFASISLFTFSPMILSGDVLQILSFVLLSEVCAVTALYALGTKQAFHSAGKLAAESAKLICLLVAAFASLAVFFTALGVHGNSFGLNVFTLSLQLRSIGMLGHVSLAVFVFLALSHSPYWGEQGVGDFFSELSFREYNGPQRAMLQIWTSFKAFLSAMLVTHIFFPGYLFWDSDGSQVGTFWLQVLGFFLFWLTAISVRVFGVMLCRKGRSMLEKKMSPAGAGLFMLLLATAAVGIIYFAAHIIAMEAY